MGSPVRRRRLIANTITTKPTTSPPTTENITTGSQDTLRTARPQDQIAECTHVGRPPSKKKTVGANPMRLVCVVRTRPEAVKLAPLVRELRNHPHIRTDVINSGQHGDAPPKLLEELGVQTADDLGTVASTSLSEMGGLGRKELLPPLPCRAFVRQLRLAQLITQVTMYVNRTQPGALMSVAAVASLQRGREGTAWYGDRSVRAASSTESTQRAPRTRTSHQ